MHDHANRLATGHYQVERQRLQNLESLAARFTAAELIRCAEAAFQGPAVVVAAYCSNLMFFQERDDAVRERTVADQISGETIRSAPRTIK